MKPSTQKYGYYLIIASIALPWVTLVIIGLYDSNLNEGNSQLASFAIWGSVYSIPLGIIALVYWTIFTVIFSSKKAN